MEAIAGIARVENTPCFPQLQDYRHVPKKVALFRRAPAVKRVTRGGFEGGVSPPSGGDGRGPLPPPLAGSTKF